MPAKRLPVVPVMPVERVQQRILQLRSQRILLDDDLARLYAVEVRTLVQAVKRNIERFPEDFMFQLTPDEWASLRSQTVILDAGRGRHRKYLPYAFTEQGVAMLTSVLRSRRAVLVNVAIMRAFVQLRRLIEGNRHIARKLQALERRLVDHDQRFVVVFEAIRRIMQAPAADEPRPRIGFRRGPGRRRAQSRRRPALRLRSRASA